MADELEPEYDAVNGDFIAEDSAAPDDVICFSVDSEYVELEAARLLEKVSKPDPVLVTRVFLAVFRAEEADEENADAERLCDK